jgi:hypothetical protein
MLIPMLDHEMHLIGKFNFNIFIKFIISIFLKTFMNHKKNIKLTQITI